MRDKQKQVERRSPGPATLSVSSCPTKTNQNPCPIQSHPPMCVVCVWCEPSQQKEGKEEVQRKGKREGKVGKGVGEGDSVCVGWGQRHREVRETVR